MALPEKLESSSFSLVPSDSKHVIRVTLNRIPENPLFPDSLCTLMVCQKKFHQKRLQIPGLTAILQHRKIGPHNPGLLDHLNFTSLDQFIDLPQLRAHLGTLASSLKPEIPTLYEDLAPRFRRLRLVRRQCPSASVLKSISSSLIMLAKAVTLIRVVLTWMLCLRELHLLLKVQLFWTNSWLTALWPRRILISALFVWRTLTGLLLSFEPRALMPFTNHALFGG